MVAQVLSGCGSFYKYFRLYQIFIFLIGFYQEPQNVVVKIGMPLLMPCSAKSTYKNAVHVFSWKHNDSWITDYRNKHYHLLGSGSLEFEFMVASDQGTYQCRVSVYVDTELKEQNLSKSVTIVFPCKFSIIFSLYSS